MSPLVTGAVLGMTAGSAVLLVCARLLAVRRPKLELRLVPYLRDLPSAGAASAYRPPVSRSVAGALIGPWLERTARALERLLGGATSIRRRLDRAGGMLTLEQFRAQQVLCGVTGFTLAAAAGVLLSAQRRAHPVALLAMCVAAVAVGVVAREIRLGTVVRRREERILAEFPTIADLLALSVAAGEGPVAALDRVVRTCRGELSTELGRLLGEIRSGVPASAALTNLARRSGLPVVSRFAEGFAVALERGTPLADVLHSQAADVREASRRALLETGARKEVAMMVPVVFLVLPVTVLFSFYPGLVGLSFVSP